MASNEQSAAMYLQATAPSLDLGLSNYNIDEFKDTAKLFAITLG